MSMSFKKIIGAGLLTAAIVGGVATYLDSTLTSAPATTVALVGVASEKTGEQPRRAEVIVTEGQAS